MENYFLSMVPLHDEDDHVMEDERNSEVEKADTPPEKAPATHVVIVT